MSETEQEATETPVEPVPSQPEQPDELTPGQSDMPGEMPQEGEEEEAGDEPEAVAPEQPAGLSEKEIEAIHKKLDAEASRHADRVSTIMGEQALDLLPCPLCVPNIPGFILPMVPPEDVKANVKAVLGEPIEPAYEKANNSRTCDGCKGLGRRLSGSLVPDQRVLLCPDCNGRGWIGVGAPLNGNQTQTEVPAYPSEPQLAPEEKPERDPWDRTPDDPDYGRMPMYVRR